MTVERGVMQSGARGWLRYGALLALLMAIMLIGYGAFRFFATGVMPDFSAYNLLALAVIAGVASFFSPCAFPLLPGYLSLYYAGMGEESNAPTSRRRVLRLGGAAALGVVTFDLVLGVVIALLGAGVAQGLSITGPEPSGFVRIFRGGVGVILMALGVAQLAGVNLKPTLVDAFAWRVRPRRSNAQRGPAFSLYLYGLGYNAAGMGCTGPILAGLTVFALGAGGFAAALGAFIVFSATMGGLMVLVTILVATSQETLVNRLKAAAPRIKRVAAFLLVGVGLFNLISALDVAGFVRLLFP